MSLYENKIKVRKKFRRCITRKEARGKYDGKTKIEIKSNI